MPAPFLLALFFLAHFSATAQAATTELCNVRIEGSEELDFSGTEEAWLCGEKNTPAWQKVPIPQQKLFLTGFLQDRGYHHPEFTDKDGILYVQVGAPERVERFTVVGAPKEFDESKRRRLRGQLLNKAALDDATNWTKRQLQQEGYPCPQVSSVGITDQNEIRLRVKAGPKQTFSIVENEADTHDLHPGVIDRYTAFQPDQPFDVRLLELTSSRILLEDLYLSTYYDVLCPVDAPPKVVRRFVPAKPRILTFSVGFDSNEGPIASAKLKWTRIDTPANSLESELKGSFREQSLTNRFRYHISPNVAPNLELVPNLTFAHREEANGETLEATVGGNAAYTWEFRDSQLHAEAGPAYSYRETLRGAGAKYVRALQINSQVTARSHLFEYYQTEPRTGWLATLNTSSQVQGLFADQTYTRLLFEHKSLWNLGRFDPPFAILGLRGKLGTFLYGGQGLRNVTSLDYFFLGGDEDIRGFDRQRLPGGGFGYTTALYEGLELRAGQWFKFNVQPFLFFDFAMGGRDSLKLSNTIHYAPGIGARYASPFGALRASLGHGYSIRPESGDPEPGWQFLFTFGKEF